MFLRDFILWLSTKKRLTDFLARRGMRAGFAQRFVAGEKLADAIGASLVLQKLGYGIILNHLGENVTTREEAARTRDSYIEMIHALETAGLRGNISIKPTQLGLDLGRDLCQSLAIEIAQEAKRLGRGIEVDMESSAYTDVTLDIFEAMQREVGNVGLAVQSYMRRSAADLERLAPLSPKIRLVKGAYREAPRIAFQKKTRSGRELSPPGGPPARARRRASFFRRDCDARSGDGRVRARKNRAEQFREGSLRISDDLRHPARLAAAIAGAGPSDADLRAVRHRLVPLLHAPARRASRELLVRVRNLFAERKSPPRRLNPALP